MHRSILFTKRSLDSVSNTRKRMDIDSQIGKYTTIKIASLGTINSTAHEPLQFIPFFDIKSHGGKNTFRNRSSSIDTEMVLMSLIHLIV